MVTGLLGTPTAVRILKYLPYILVTPILLFQALALSGCLSTSPGIADLYIVSITKNTTEIPEIRIGYFGMCSVATDTGTICTTTKSHPPEHILPILFPSVVSSNSSTVSSLLTNALTLQQKVFYPILPAAAALFALAVIFFACIMSETKKHHAKGQRTLMMWLLCLALGVSLTVSLAITESVWALEYSPSLSGVGTDAATIVQSGSGLQTLQWFSFALTVIFTMNVHHVLDEEGKPKRSKSGDA